MLRERVVSDEPVVGKVVRLEIDPLITQAEDGAWLRYVFALDLKKENVSNDEAESGSALVISDDLGIIDDNDAVTANDDSTIGSMGPLVVDNTLGAGEETMEEVDETENTKKSI